MGEPVRAAPVFDAEMLTKKLPTGTSAGLDPTDPRLDEISGLVFKGSYAEVALRAQEIWQSGTLDVRLLGYYLMGIFLDRGVPGFTLMFQSATAALTERWAELVPADRKTDLADAALGWLFEHLLKRLQRHQKGQDAQWRQWSRQATEPILREALEASEPLEAAMTAVLTQHKSVNRLRSFQQWLDELAATPPAFEAQNSLPPPAATPAPAPAPAPPRKEEERPPVADAPKQEGEPLSPAMALLIRKLDGFHELVRREEFQKAAVVALDVENVIQNFDPRVYFPRMFGPYFGALHSNADALEPAMSDTESFAAKALTQLYRVDLEAFLRGK